LCRSRCCLITALLFSYRVENVSQTEGIRIRGALDRNGVSLHPGYAPNFVLPLASFLQLCGTEFKIFSAEENERIFCDVRERRLRITYQSFSKMDFSPISVTPKGIDLFSEYKVVYDERSQRLKRVLHKEDGPVLYEGIKDQGEFGLWDGEPIHIYSMVHSEKTHRILHIHLNDIRADVAVDAVNITGSDKSVDDMRDLLNKKDTSGRLLSYRIVIKDAQVKAVFHHSGKAKRAKFIEETLPSIGSLVAVNYQQQHLQSSTVSFSSTLATLLWVPAGMIVKSSMKSSKKKKGEGEEDDTENEEVDDIIDGKQDITFPKSNFCSCRRKHPVELPGFVHVRLEQHVGVTEKGEDEITVFPEVQGNDEDVLAASTVEGKKDCLMSSDDDDISQRCSPRRRYISVPVCCLRKATEQEKLVLLGIRE